MTQRHIIHTGPISDCRLIQSILAGGEYSAACDVEFCEIVKANDGEDTDEWRLIAHGLIRPADADYLSAFANGIVTGACRMEGAPRELISTVMAIATRIEQDWSGLARLDFGMGFGPIVDQLRASAEKARGEAL